MRTAISLNILRQSVPDTEIETIHDVRPVGRHPGFRVGGMPVAEGSTKIRLQDMTMPFDFEITVRSGHDRHRLRTTFTIDCRKVDETPENEYRLEIHEQTGL